MIRRRYRLIRALELAVLGVLMTIAAFALELACAAQLDLEAGAGTRADHALEPLDQPAGTQPELLHLVQQLLGVGAADRAVDRAPADEGPDDGERLQLRVELARGLLHLGKR